MSNLTRTSLMIGFAAIGLSILTFSAQADPYLPGITNLDFSQYTGSAPKGCFSCVNPTGWTGGGGLIFIDSTGPGQDAAGPVYLQTYGDPSPNLSGNYVEADGNPQYESSFSTLLTGLTVGQQYELIFDQAASQQTGFGNGLNTTEQWIVSLGTSGLSFCDGCGAYDPYYNSNQSNYYNVDPNADVQASPIMTTPSGGTNPWEQVTMFLTADNTTDLLSFLAWGDDGTTANLPPIVFLTGVDTPNNNIPPASPEPASLVLFGSALAGLGVLAARRRRAAKS